MNSINCPIILALVVVYFAGLCYSCGIPDLMQEGKAMQKKAEAICKKELTDAQKQAIKACLDTEMQSAEGRPYHEYLKKAMDQCFKEDMMNDPCSDKTKQEGEKCGKQFMKDNPDLKSKAMSWVNPHCKDFKAHMQNGGACVEKALAS